MPTVRRHKRSRTVRHKYDYDRMTKSLVIFIIWLAILLIPIAFYGARYFHGLDSNDAVDIAQIAKQEALGRGFVSGYTKPAMAQLTKRIVYPPNIVRAPLHIWVLSFFPGVKESSDGSVSFCSSIFFVLSGILILQFARMHSGFGKAIVVSIIYLLNVTMLQAAISGLSYTLTGFLFMLLCFFIYIDNSKSFLLSFLLGLLCGALYLSDYHYLPVILPVTLCILGGHAQDKWRFLALFLIGAAAVTLPWILRNHGMGLNPFVGYPIKYRLIQGAPLIKERLTFGRFGLAKFDELYVHAAVINKFIINLMKLYNGLMNWGGLFIMVAFVGSIFIPFNGLGTVRSVVYGSIALVVFVICLDDGQVAGLTPLFPMMIFMGVLGMYKLVDSADTISDNVKAWIIRGFIACTILPFLGALSSAPNPRYMRQSMEKSRLVIEELGNIVGGHEVVLTDEPWKLAWYSGIPSIQLPESEEDYEQLVNNAGEFRYVYLSRDITKKKMKLWSGIFTSRAVPSWFPLKEGHVLSDRSLILSDKKRW